MAAVDSSRSSSSRHFAAYPFQETPLQTKPISSIPAKPIKSSSPATITLSDAIFNNHDDEDEDNDLIIDKQPLVRHLSGPKRKKKHAGKFFRSVFHSVVFCKRPPERPHLGSRVVGTLFGHRKGHVHFAFQNDPDSTPAILVELATPTCSLVREMASGLVRIALECEKQEIKGRSGKKMVLLEEPVWRVFCNGRKSGFAVARTVSGEDLRVFKAIQAISMGAGVLPGSGPEGELMYMRARFERVVGSKDSEAFYMMNPDRNIGGPELSIFLLRV